MMMDYILQGFRERVSQMNWLSDLSKQRSIEKINEMQQTVEDCLPHSK